MNTERWWWLWVFCVVSLCIHVVIGLNSRSLGMRAPLVQTAEIEVSLEPPAPEKEPEKKPDKKPEARKPEPEKQAEPEKAVPARGVPFRKALERVARAQEPRHRAESTPRTAEREAVKPVPPGGTDPLKDEQPLPLGLPAGKPEIAPRLRIAQAPPAPSQPEARDTDLPVEPAAEAPPQLAPGPVTPRMTAGTGPALSLENPLAGPLSREEKPSLAPRPNGPAGSPNLVRIARANLLPAGGGSPSPGPVPGGRDGFKGPQAPLEDILFNGGGAGGTKLPKAAPRIGGGGGRSILSVDNPLAKDAVPEDRPGLGPGRGGGQGAGAGEGVGYARGKGIGTNPDGRYALSTLRSRPGPGIGAGSGSGIGTRPPGGGRGTGAELPGTGGKGAGYGRGAGTGIGDGLAPGIGGRGGRGGSGGGGGGGGRVVLNRGIPFGDITGLLSGDPNGGGGKGGGPGGPGRGPGAGPRGAGGGPVVALSRAHIVYVLDTSTSMRQGNKIGKAKEALKRALSELKEKDTFNIITFNEEIEVFSPAMVAGTQENLDRAMGYVDSLRMRQGTNMSAALEQAFAQGGISHVFLLSDGEPSRGITDPGEICAHVRQWNHQRAQMLTLALGLGDDFPGIPLLKALAGENSGKFSYINLAR